MPVLPLVEPKDMEPDIRQTMEMFNEWIGDKVYSQFMAHVPDLFRKFNDFYMACLNGRVESEPKELARLRLARLNSCDYWKVANIVWARRANVPEAKVRDIDHYWDSDAYTEREKTILKLADAFAHSTKGQIPDDTLALAKKHFTDPEIVEIGCYFAMVTGFQKFNSVFHIEYGGVCPMPLPEEASTK